MGQGYSRWSVRDESKLPSPSAVFYRELGLGKRVSARHLALIGWAWFLASILSRTSGPHFPAVGVLLTIAGLGFILYTVEMMSVLASCAGQDVMG